MGNSNHKNIDPPQSTDRLDPFQDVEKDRLSKLKTFFLSKKAMTSVHEESTKEFVQMVESDITKLFTDNIPGISSMMDRTGSTPVCQYIVSTYNNGLPIFKSNPAVQQHTIHSLKYVIYKASTFPDRPKKQVLRRLAEAFTACQMEQGRVIDSLYGSLSGREKSFRDQVE